MAYTAAQINTIYQRTLQRDASAAEQSSWAAVSSSGSLTDAQIVSAIVNSAEAVNGVQAVIRVYQAAFGRVPDQGGLDAQTDGLVRGGLSIKQIAAGFVVSQEFANKYNAGTLVVDNAAAVTPALLQALYQNVLGREGSAAEISAWQTAVATPGSGYARASDVLFGFSQSPEFTGKAAAAVATFLTAAANGTQTYVGPLLDPAAGTGSTFTLTDKNDTFTGGAGADTFNAVNGSVNTLTNVDVIDGGAGVDSLNILLDAAGSVLATAGIKNIEKFFLRDIGDGTTVDFSTVVGETQVWNDRSTFAMTFDKLAAGTTVGVKGDGSTVVEATTFSMAAAADAVSIAIDGGVTGGKAITNTGNGPTAATVVSTGGANTVGAIVLSAGATVTASTITATTDLTTGNITGHKAASTMTITGSGKANLGTLENAVDTVNASAHTGGLTLTLDTEATTKVTAGSGADTITTNATLTTGNVDAGGGTDVLVVGATAHLNTKALGDKFTNFETLRVNDGVTVDLSHVGGITAVQINDGGGATSVTNLSAAQAGAIAVRAGNAAGAITIGVKDAMTVGNIDTVKIDANDGASATSTVALGQIAMAGVENFELTATDNVTIASLVDSSTLASIVLKGAGTIGLTTGAVSTINSHIDGSAATGVLTITAAAFATNGIKITGGTAADDITGSAQADNIIGGAGNDKLTAGAGADTVVGGDGNDTIDGGQGADTATGGAGTDTFSFAATAAANTNGATFGTFDNITDFVVGTDKLQFSGVADVISGQQAGVQAAVTALAAGSSATAIATAMATANTTNLGVSFAVFEGNTYVLYETTGAGTGVIADDVFIRLTGVTTAPTFGADVIA
ncbi:MAG: DUF4214 domain-containing protein [Rhabdaerophilum sp.]